MTLAQEAEQRKSIRGRFWKGDRFKIHTFWNSLANNVASPFVGFNVTSSGASDLLIGYVQAVNSLASGISQLIGGRIADKTGKRVRITILFSIVTGVLWLGSAFFQSPTFLAVTFTIITLSIGLYTAGWTSIVGEASEGTGKGIFLAGFAKIASIGGLLALALTTLLTALYPSYTMLYLLSGGFFILSAFVLKGQKEQTVERKISSSSFRTVDGLGRFYLVSGFYGVFWGFAWPLFTITTVKIVRMDLFQYSLAQMIAVGSTIAFHPWLGDWSIITVRVVCSGDGWDS